MGLKDKTKLPQVLKKLDQYLQTQGYELSEPYEDIRLSDNNPTKCVLCDRMSALQVVIPALTVSETGATSQKAVCANLADCHKWRKTLEEQKASALVARAKELEGKLVLPKGN